MLHHVKKRGKENALHVVLQRVYCVGIVNLYLYAGPPEIPTNVIAWSGGPFLLSVSWLEEFNGGLPQIFLVQYRADTETRWTNMTKQLTETGLKTVHGTSVSDLQPKTRYFVRVFAYNRQGHKGYSPQQEVVTDGNHIFTSFDHVMKYTFLLTGCLG